MVVDVAPAGRLAGVADYNIFPVCNKAKRFAKNCDVVFTISGE
jgi:hypothetical protein